MRNTKSCPFCGSFYQVVEKYSSDTPDIPAGYRIGCSNCEIFTAPCPTRDRAINQWNRRAEEI